MKTDRNIKELLILMRDNIDKISPFSTPYGLCGLVWMLGRKALMSQDEVDMCEQYLIENKPVQASDGEYWWTEGDIPPRLKWLNEQIDKLEKRRKR